MNIFKVLASGKKSFQEETASALLTWLMNPTMEHGLGYSFLARFIKGISISSGNNKLSDMANILSPKLRNETERHDLPWFRLEYRIENYYIDIVFGVEDWIFSIENKIYANSFTENQLQYQYNLLRANEKLSDKKICVVYLVPIDDGSETANGKIEKEYADLFLKNQSDIKVLATWQRSQIENTFSVFNIIDSILKDEINGLIDPISEYTRHTMKALNSFILSNFSGYEYEKEIGFSGRNPLTENIYTFNELKKINIGFVGVKGGIKGLLKMDNDLTKKFKFQYAAADMTNKQNWIDILTFTNVSLWKLYNDTSNKIEWKGRLPAKYLYLITKDFGSNFYIGIKGGESALRNMDKEIIINKEWEISREKSSINSNWIEGKLFYDILNTKNIQWT